MPYKYILLIDDESDDTQFFVEAVQAVSNQTVCRTALNPAAALEELKTAEELPDIIFLDYNIRQLTGWSFSNACSRSNV